jgi:hypothetical protein
VYGFFNSKETCNALIDGKTGVEGIIHITLSSHPDTLTSKGYAVSTAYNGAYYSQTWNINSEYGFVVPGLHLSLGGGVSVVINCGVTNLYVSGVGGDAVACKNRVTVIGHVDTLVRGEYPYSNVRTYGKGCFRQTSFVGERVVVLPDGLETIIDRAFYRVHGAEYIVVPRSVEYIGSAAFSECRYGGGLTTLCVYRDSYGERWAKGKKLSILVIDSLDDIPAPMVVETDKDFIAAFAGPLSGADKSKPFVARLLLSGRVDIMQYIVPVAEIPDDALQFLSESAETDPRTFMDGAKGLLLWASSMHDIYGSRLELLQKKILRAHTWSVREDCGVTCWIGILSASLDDEDGRRFTERRRRLVIIASGRSVIYVGCAQTRGNAFYRVESGVYVPVYEDKYAIGSVMSAALLLTPELEGGLIAYGKMTYANRPTRLGGNVAVHGEQLRGDARTECNRFLWDDLAYVSVRKGQHSGREHEYISYLYSVETRKIYRFVALAHIKAINELGMYRGEVSVDQYIVENKAEFDGTRRYEDTLVTLPSF